MRTWKLGLLCAAVALTTVIGVSSLAQQPPPAGAGQGVGGRQGGRGQRGFGQMSISTIPADALAGPLKLTAEQKTKIAAIQEKSAKDRQALMQPDANGQRPNFQEIGPKIQELNQQTTKDIDAVLTDDQKKMVPDVVKDFQTLQGVGIPAGVVGDLKLTADQKTKLAEVSKSMQTERQAKLQEAQGDRTKLREIQQELQKTQSDKVNAVLTDTQKTTLEKYLKDHPQPRFGGGGFGGGRRPGGAGGNPPPPPAH